VTIVSLFRRDDLSGLASRALVLQHLAEMRASSPEESVHAFDVEGLLRPDVTLWSVWVEGTIAGCGALRDLHSGRGEIKSMHVAAPFRGRGVGRAILDHIVGEARARGMKTLWLETGSSPSFLPALALYERAGFRRCGPFDDYGQDPFSVFMVREL
jgi:putative acetyltransferase